MNPMWKEIRLWLDKHAAATVSDAESVYRFSALAELAEQHAARLKSVVRPGMKCAILCEKGIHTAVALLSCWSLELVPVPLCPHYGEQHSQNILDLIEPEILITDFACACTAAIKYHMNNSAMEYAPTVRKAEDDLQAVALILCTSGTTGKPKGVMLTADGLLYNVRAIGRYFPVGEEDTVLIARPLFHSAVLTGELLLALYTGAHIVFHDRKFSPMGVIACADSHKATVLCGTPTLLGQIALYAGRYKKQLALRTIALSGEGLSAHTAKIIRDAFPEAAVYHVYGLTEASPRVSYLPSAWFDRDPTSAGIPLEGIEIRIADEQDKPLPAGEHGRILVKTPGVMKGYYHNPVETNRRLRDGWLYTGDIGFVCADGRLHVISREDDMILKGGMNIYPREIEDPVAALPQVKECAAYGVQTDCGQTIALDIVLTPEYADMKKKELMQLLTTLLPAYLLPAHLNIVDALARTASGKRVRMGLGDA